MKEIQGLEHYSYDEIIEIINDFIIDRIWDSGHSSDDIKITDIRLHGSRLRGQAKQDSDLDAVVEYDGDIREDDFFNILNDEDSLYIDDVRVDINPIKEGLDLYMKRSKAYDKKKLNLESRIRRLEKRLLKESTQDLDEVWSTLRHTYEYELEWYKVKISNLSIMYVDQDGEDVVRIDWRGSYIALTMTSTVSKGLNIYKFRNMAELDDFYSDGEDLQNMF